MPVAPPPARQDGPQLIRRERLNEAGVEILPPHYRAQRDGNATTVPSILGKADYEVPRFRIESAPSDK